MKIIPAIDIRGGRAVRLLRGDKDTETVYGEDPVATALEWQRQGAEWLHIVDLDGAFSEKRHNRSVIEEILRRLEIPVQVGGGVRTFEDFKCLVRAGADRVVIGTAAIEEPAVVMEALRLARMRVVIGVDVRRGQVAVRGWEVESGETPLEFGRQWKDRGVSTFLFTDIQRDGSLEGPNIDALREFCRCIGTGVIASGGVSSLEDLKRLSALGNEGVESVVVGKAVYEGKFTLAEAMVAVRAQEA
jgi:phosphoribosylformimino-5-aminoimidazole carboxamide ribotide isomerase